MSTVAHPPEFFVAGGTLRADAPSYVARPTDDELFELTLAGEYCYALTPRQMGKSSLMVRTAQRLEEYGVCTAIIDLTRIGADISAGRWYLSLLSQLRRRLNLSADPVDWWEKRAALGDVHRFVTYFQDVILVELKERIVVFVDEIDVMLRLNFRDDFFAAIRSMYNARAGISDFERLTFVLLGVASPPELMKDPARTPFNIGQSISLAEFSRDDAVVLQEGLEAAHPGQCKLIFDRIYYWTSGHPYLTQKLCLSVAQDEDGSWDQAQVDALVKRLFLSEETRKEANVQFVQDAILTHPWRQDMLSLYREVLRGKPVSDEGQSPVQNQLELSGIIKDRDGYLVVRNEIYRHAFDIKWIRKNTPTNWTPIIVTIAALVALLGLASIGYGLSRGRIRTFAAIPVMPLNQPENTIIFEGDAARVNIEARAAQSVLDDLTISDFEAAMDLTNVASGMTTLVPISVVCNVERVRIESYDPQDEVVRLEEVRAMTLPVQIDLGGQTASGYLAYPPVFTPSQVTVRGAVPYLTEVVAVTGDVDLDGARENVVERVPIRPVNGDGQLVADVQWSPEQVEVSIRVQRRVGYRPDVVVVPDVRGSPARGYRWDKTSVEPEMLTLVGNASALYDLPGFLWTEPITITDRTGSLTTYVWFDLPPGIFARDVSFITVTVDILPVISSRTMTSTIEIEGLRPGWVASLSPPVVYVTLEGPLIALEELTSDDITVFVDVLGYGLGVHQMEPLILPTEEITTVDTLPGSIEVVIMPQPTPTSSR